MAEQGRGETASYIISSQNLIAMALLGQGQTRAAIAQLERSAQQARSILGPHPNTVAVLLNLGLALEADQQIEAAVAVYQQAGGMTLQAHTEGLQPVDSKLQQQAWLALARLHTDRGETTLAAQAQQQLTRAAAQASTAMQRQSRWQQARLDMTQGRYQAAALSLQQLLDSAAAAPDEAGSVPSTLDLVRSLAQAHSQLDHKEQASALHLQALALLDGAAARHMAPASRRKARLAHHNELGILALLRKDSAAAQHHLQQAQALLQASPSDFQALEHAAVLANLAQWHEASGQQQAAVDHYQQAASHYAQVDTPDSWLGQAQILNFLAGRDYMKRRLQAAQQQYEQALALIERAAGAQAPQLLAVLDNLATLAQQQQRHNAAAGYRARAEEIRSQPASLPPPAPRQH
jgi:hypothetical protein